MASNAFAPLYELQLPLTHVRLRAAATRHAPAQRARRQPPIAREQHSLARVHEQHRHVEAAGRALALHEARALHNDLGQHGRAAAHERRGSKAPALDIGGTHVSTTAAAARSEKLRLTSTASALPACQLAVERARARSGAYSGAEPAKEYAAVASSASPTCVPLKSARARSGAAAGKRRRHGASPPAACVVQPPATSAAHTMYAASGPPCRVVEVVSACARV